MIVVGKADKGVIAMVLKYIPGTVNYLGDSVLNIYWSYTGHIPELY